MARRRMNRAENNRRTSARMLALAGAMEGLERPDDLVDVAALGTDRHDQVRRHSS